MRFSVIVPTYNRRATLRQTLAALAKQDYADYEVIVVDDGSTDGTGAMVSQDFPQVRYLHQVNAGPATARNRGWRAGQGDIIVFTDDDCEPPPDWLSQLAGGYQRYPQAAGIGGTIRAPAEVVAGNLLAQYEQHVAREVFQATEAEAVGGFENPAGGTNNMSYRRSVLEAVGGFDERFPVAAGEDADLKWRICQRGEQLGYVPVQVIHLQDYTWPRFFRQSYVRGIGRNYFEALHGDGWPSRLKVLLRIAKRVLTFFGDLGGGQPARLAAVKLAEGLFTCWGQMARPPRKPTARAG